MKRWCSAVLVAVALVVPAAAHAGSPVSCLGGSTNPFATDVVPAVHVCVNGFSLFTFTGFTGNGKAMTLAPQTQNFAAASFTVSASVNSDPFVTFSFSSFLAAGAGPFSFDVFITTPVVSGAYTNATSVGTLALGTTGAATGSVTNNVSPAFISGFGNPNSLGVNTGVGPCTVSSPPTPNSINCNPPGASNNFAAINPGTMAARINYTQDATGNGSSTASWTGTVSLNSTVVPEPATIGLVFAGVMLIGVARVRKRLV